MLIPFCIYFSSFIVWLWFFALAKCINIFKGADYTILALWYLFKDMKYNCIVWWWFFTLLFSYCHLSSIAKIIQNMILIWNTARRWIDISIVDRLSCMDSSFMLLRTIWLYLTNVIISFFPSLLIWSSWMRYFGNWSQLCYLYWSQLI